ncbi:MAG: hypothetical protein SV375_00820 [Thermodesulfobacteriota bacterium]|nr:hypothetical protein [Thermodesulfobacteriota bacterium]
MDIFDMDDFKKLVTGKQNGPCVSIYMPSDRTNAEKNRIRFKNLFGEAEKMMAAMGIGDVDMAEGLKPARRLLEDQTFWQHQSDGLALFLSDERFETYRLPVAFEEAAVVTDRFYIKPLVPFITSDARFFVLAVSQSFVRLFQCTRQEIQEVEPEEMPKGLAETLKYDDPEKQLQFHTGTGGTGGKRPAVFHGQGVGADDAKDRILRYFREIDKWLCVAMRREGGPLILAGVDYLFPIYREANSYPHLLEQDILGNPDEMKEKELHDKAWDLMEPHIKKVQDDAVGRYQDLVGTGKTSKDLKEIVAAAVYGQVAVLFVARGIQQWGRFDPESDRVDIHQTQRPGDEDLLDLAALETLLKGGEVYVIKRQKVPEDAPAAALFRY